MTRVFGHREFFANTQKAIRALPFATLLAVTGCGGGGGNSDNQPPPDSSSGCSFGGLPLDTISIKRLSADFFVFVEVVPGVYETESPSVTLSGNVTSRTNLSVEVSNSDTGEMKTARTWGEITPLCLLGHWEAESMALQMGSNTFTADDQNATESVMVRRVVDNTAPSVESAFPADGSNDVDTNTLIRARFDDFMDASTINNTTILVSDSAGDPVAGTVTFDEPAREVTFDPDHPLLVSSVYTVRITTAVTDDVGHPLAQDYVWSFTTVDDGTAPTLLLFRPVGDEVCVDSDAAIAARFDEPLALSTLDSSTVVVEDEDGSPVTGTIAFQDVTLTFTPDTSLAGGKSYTVEFKDGITDNAGTPLTPESWTFTTGFEPEGTWAPIAATNIGPRDKHTAVWTGSAVLIFGGQGASILPAGTHGSYDPALDQWSELSGVDAPFSRWSHSATWTGSEMIVWGGRDWNAAYGSGGRYAPATDTWLPVSYDNDPSDRYDHSAVWTGSRLIIWGGRRIGQGYGDGALYDPVTDTWTPMSDVNAPLPRNRHHAFWDGQYMIVWGGREDAGSQWLKDGAMYEPITDVWLPLPSQNAPDPSKSGMLDTSAAWTGIDLFVWSYYSKFQIDDWTGDWIEVEKNEGRRFNRNVGWQTVVDACGTDTVPNEAWLEGKMLSWNSDLSAGYFYDEQRNAWISVTPFIGNPVTDATIVAADGSIIVFGGDGGIMSRDRKNEGFRLTF